MISTETRLYAAMDRVAPEAARPGPAEADVELVQLGFDSMALIALFVELEREFALSLEALSTCLHRRCTWRGLLALCGSAVAPTKPAGLGDASLRG